MAWYACYLTEQQNLNNGVRTRRPFLLEGNSRCERSPSPELSERRICRGSQQQYDRTADGGEKLKQRPSLSMRA